MNVETVKTAQQAIHTIFLADDDPDDRDMFRGALEAIDTTIKLECIEDGYALLSLLDHLHPDLLFLDLEMPRKNGLECLKEIRNSDIYQQLPIVVFSSTNRKHNINTAYEVGAHLFMNKPNTFSQMQELLKKILRLDWKRPMEVKAQYFREGKGGVFS